MIPSEQFIPRLQAALPERFGAAPPNHEQLGCIESTLQRPLMIVAGPGTGKTTVLVLRALRKVFVDGLQPQEILLTTFTKKAAQELRSRLLAWGERLKEHIRREPPNGWTPENARALSLVDLNRFVTGTLDSLCEEIINTARQPGDVAPTVVEGFVGDALLLRHGVYPSGMYRNGLAADTSGYLSGFSFDTTSPPRNAGELLSTLRPLVDRFIHDRIDLADYRAGVSHSAGRRRVADCFDQYRRQLQEDHRIDFAGLELMFLDRVASGRLDRFAGTIRAVLVDEYQDTNPLQEAIYFELVRCSGAALTVVGDDDQSLYRFRGATVELFTSFRDRLATALPTLADTDVRYLTTNYRSTPEVVQFFNDYIVHDPGFDVARVQPPKPQIVPHRESEGIPVLGLFRDSANALADAIAELLQDVFRGNGRLVDTSAGNVLLQGNANGGDVGDAVLLASSVRELKAAYGNNPPEQRLPRLVRDRLQASGMRVFNPRGEELRDVRSVGILLGLLLECIDPPQRANDSQGRVEADCRLRRSSRRYFPIWRGLARDFVRSDPDPTIPRRLSDFVDAWGTRHPNAGGSWPEEWPLLELLFKLLTWMPGFRYDPEGQVFIEAVARCIAESATISPYRSVIRFGAGDHDDRSVQNALHSVFEPMAETAVELDEEVMPEIPRSSFPIMTIHQSKGLEFPMVMVDVGSDFRTNHHANRFKRHPNNPSAVQNLEDDLAPHCEIGPLRLSRSGIDRAFDDLQRLYYVAYSRAQTALILVGLNSMLRTGRSVPHVATWWRRDGTWAWNPNPGRRPPPLPTNHPLTLI